jgi:hypothetical protein
LAAASAEEAQKRQATRQRRADHILEDFEARLAKIEESAALPQTVELHLQELEELGAQVGAIGARMESLEVHIDAFKLMADAGADFDAIEGKEGSEDDCGSIPRGDPWGKLHMMENTLQSMDRRLSAQLEDVSSLVASLRVKVDGQGQRQVSLADRLETAHVPALDVVRSDLTELHTRDTNDLRAQISEIARKLEFDSDALDIEQLAQKLERLSHRVSGGEASTSALRRDVNDLRGNLDRRNKLNSGGMGSIAEVAGQTIQEQLGAVADQLDAVDDLARRLDDLSSRVSGLEKTHLQAQDKGFPIHQLGDSAINTDKMLSKSDVPSRRKSSALPNERPPLGSGTLSDGVPPLPMIAATVQCEERGQPHHAAPQNLDIGAPGSMAREMLRDRLQRNEGAMAQTSLRTPLVRPSPNYSVIAGASPSPSPLVRPVSEDASLVSAPELLLRKDHSSSSLSCDIAIVQDECVDPTCEDVLQSRCDITVDVISPSHASMPGHNSMGSASSPQHGKKDNSSSGSSVESFEESHHEYSEDDDMNAW